MSKKQKYERIEVPMVSLNPNYLALYKAAVQFTGRSKGSGNAPETFYDAATNTIQTFRSEKQIKSERNLENNSTNGIISLKASKKINQALSWFTALSKTNVRKFKNGYTVKNNLSFITLTLSDKQKHSDQVIKNKLLNAFLIDIRRKYYVTSYLWRAEAQTNGNIHFHIVINRFIDKLAIAKIWNRIQDEHGYLDNYKATKGHADAPSTEIKAVYECKNIAGYLSKYVSKNTSQLTLDSNITAKDLHKLVKATDGLIAAKWHSTKKHWLVKFADQVLNENQIKAFVETTGATVYSIEVQKIRNIEGRQWYCSTTISKLKNVSEVVSDEIEEDLQAILQRGAIKYKRIEKDFVTLLCFDVADAINAGLFPGLKELFDVNWYRFHAAESASFIKAFVSANPEKFAA